MFIKFFEKFGIFFFIISILIISQLRWARMFHYDDIELRITMCFIFSIIIYLGINKIIIDNNINADNISFALSFSLVGIYLKENTYFIILLIVISIIYLIKKYRSKSIFESFWGHEGYKTKLHLDQGIIKVTNNSNKDLNIHSTKYLFSDLINCIITCKNNNMTKIFIDINESKIMNDLIINLFSYFGIQAKSIIDTQTTKDKL